MISNKSSFTLASLLLSAILFAPAQACRKISERVCYCRDPYEKWIVSDFDRCNVVCSGFLREGEPNRLFH